MRWNTRSAPERSTRTGMPGYFASKDLAIRSAADRSIDVYQTTLPSFFAASISAGVIALGRRRGCEDAKQPAVSAPARSRP